MNALQGALEENVLTLLVWSDQHASRLSMELAPELFSTRAYQRIAKHAVDYIQRYGRAPRAHIRDLLEESLRRADEGQLLSRTLDAMQALEAELQPEFVLEKLEYFIASRQMAMAVSDAADLLHAGNLEEARDRLYSLGLSTRAGWTVGTFLTDTSASLSFLNKRDEDFFSSGVDLLDDRGVRPARKQLFLGMAAAKKGKSWWLVEIGKRAMLHRKTVLHISLENSEELTSQRYIQALFAMTSEKVATIRTAVFKKDALGHCLDLEFDSRSPEMISSESRAKVARKLQAFKNRAPLLIKEFPTSTLTIGQLNSYLDMLERQHNFKPDLLIVDYPDLMAIDANSLRIDTGRLFRELRGIAVTRNLAIAAVTQGNRGSADARVVTQTHVAEDWSKIGTADVVVTYSQTAAEHELGLARIYVAAARGTRDKYIAMISQNYDTGQFCLDSVYMNRYIEQTVNRLTGGEEKTDGADG